MICIAVEFVFLFRNEYDGPTEADEANSEMGGGVNENDGRCFLFDI